MNRLSRRAALQRAGLLATAATGAALTSSAEAEAAGSAPFIVVDTGGGGDYTDLEQAVSSAPSGSRRAGR